MTGFLRGRLLLLLIAGFFVDEMGNGQSFFVDEVGKGQKAFAGEVVVVRASKFVEAVVIVVGAGQWFLTFATVEVVLVREPKLFVVVIEVVVLLGGGQRCFSAVEFLVIICQWFVVVDVEVVEVIKGEGFFDAGSSVERRLKSKVGGVMVMPDSATLGIFEAIFLTVSGFLKVSSLSMTTVEKFISF